MELINKEFNVWVKSLTELTFKDIVDSYAGSGDDQVKIFDTAIIYERKTGRIILYKESPFFEALKMAVIAYLSAEDSKRHIVKAISEFSDTVFNILDEAIAEKEVCDIMQMLDKQKPDTYWNGFDIINFIVSNEKREFVKASYIFDYGVICGKRMERAKKRKGSTSQKLPQQKE